MRLTHWFVFGIILISLAACSGREGQLKPLATSVLSGQSFDTEPELVTFAQLEANPEQYQDRLIRVTGNFLHLAPPECYPYLSYGAEWSLVSEALRLDALGFEDLMRLVAEGLTVTVDGFFRLYQGPLGCGKTAPLATAWYLQTLRIVQPNPLVRTEGENGFGVVLISPTPFGTLLPPGTIPGLTITPGGTAVQTGVPTGTPTIFGTMIPTSTGTITPTGTRLTTGTPGPSPTPSVTGTITVTPVGSPSLTATAGPGTATATSGPRPTQPPLPTSYPGFPTATSTISPYPPQVPTSEPTGYP